MRQFHFDDDNLPDQEEMEMLYEFSHQFGPPEAPEQTQLVAYHLNQELLKQATQLCEKSLFWKFRSMASKREEIKQTYRFLESTITDSEDEEEIVVEE